MEIEKEPRLARIVGKAIGEPGAAGAGGTTGWRVGDVLGYAWSRPHDVLASEPDASAPDRLDANAVCQQDAFDRARITIENPARGLPAKSTEDRDHAGAVATEDMAFDGLMGTDRGRHESTILPIYTLGGFRGFRRNSREFFCHYDRYNRKHRPIDSLDRNPRPDGSKIRERITRFVRI